MRVTKLSAVLLMLMTVSLSAQQDPQYNLYQFNPLVINPAYAGARDALQVIGAHRQQWLGFPGAPVTSCLSVHAPVFGRKLGVGLTVVNDEIGPRNVISAYGNIAYILKISEDMKLSFGVNAGYNRYQFNFTEISFKNGEAPAELYQNVTPGTLDLNSGLLLRSKSFFVAVSASHLNNPNVYTYQPAATSAGEFTYKLRTHYFVMAGYSFILGDNAVFAPTVMFKSLGTVNSADANMNFLLYKKLWVGAFYRYNYGVGGLVQYLVTSKLKVGYSYDTGLNQSGRLGGSHEVMIGYDFLPNRTHFINPRFL
jgi:type IX secretion system PorP/SprF family membrane protein